MREVGLRLPGVVEPFHGGHDHAGVSLREILMTPFELDQLGHADRSPPASEEDEDLMPIAGQVVLGERRAVGLLRLERREGASHRDRPRVGREPQRVQDRELGAREGSTSAKSASTRQTVHLFHRDMGTRATPSNARAGMYDGTIRR
jgi:hypothetical protein